ncbi:MAG TPA: septum formation family protein [Nocardioides sp.]|uniref:septum formation family protein n=1 Tax=Nocardioides sp. TaxID=35761 RepID=UPI002F3E69D6
MPHAWRVVVPLVLLAISLSGCLGRAGGTPSPVDEEVPDLGACRLLSPDDVSQPSNSTEPVSCDQPHTAQTYAVGPLPGEFVHASYDDGKVAAFAYKTCSAKFIHFTGADASLAMRSILSWAWFRPSQAAWDQGARWYRCDVVGGGQQSRTLVDLPSRTKGLLLGRPDDDWMVCAQGTTVSSAVKIPCSQKHNWRAVTTIVLGAAGDPYPGDEVVKARTRDFCSKSVGAWLDYPVDYDFGYSWFHEVEWDAGNRRSVCWARTDK